MRLSHSHCTAPIAAVTIALSAGLVGCAPKAYKITPIPAEQDLEETVILEDGGFGAAKIVLIDVDGILVNSHKRTLFGSGEHPVSLLVEKLDKAAKDKRVRGLIIRINSPGGTVTASDLIHSEIRHFKQSRGDEVPVVAVMMDVAASGGYYIACATDEIVAHPTTVTGSIGVVMQLMDVSDTLAKIGVRTEAIASGPMKTAGSPFKHLSPEERQIFQGLIDGFYDRFVQVVADGRAGLNEDQVRELADGRVYSADQALEMGFVDRVGTLRDAVAAMKKTIGAERARVVAYHRPLSWKPNIYAESPSGPTEVNLMQLNLPQGLTDRTPQFLYLWAPGMQ